MYHRKNITDEPDMSAVAEVSLWGIKNWEAVNPVAQQHIEFCDILMLNFVIGIWTEIKST